MKKVTVLLLMLAGAALMCWAFTGCVVSSRVVVREWYVTDVYGRQFRCHDDYSLYGAWDRNGYHPFCIQVAGPR